jgi:hypothetical protein
MKFYDLWDPIYRVALTVIVTQDRSKFYKWLDKTMQYKEMEDVDIDGARGYFLDLNPENSNHKGVCYVIWLHKRDINTFVHESAHLAMHVFSSKGIPLHMENTEAFAYYHEFWLNETRKAWK